MDQVGPGEGVVEVLFAGAAVEPEQDGPVGSAAGGVVGVVGHFGGEDTQWFGAGVVFEEERDPAGAGR